jgi:hypothetical protein
VILRALSGSSLLLRVDVVPLHSTASKVAPEPPVDKVTTRSLVRRVPAREMPAFFGKYKGPSPEFSSIPAPHSLVLPEYFLPLLKRASNIQELSRALSNHV